MSWVFCPVFEIMKEYTPITPFPIPLMTPPDTTMYLVISEDRWGNKATCFTQRKMLNQVWCAISKEVASLCQPLLVPYTTLSWLCISWHNDHVAPVKARIQKTRVWVDMLGWTCLCSRVSTITGEHLLAALHTAIKPSLYSHHSTT